MSTEKAGIFCADCTLRTGWFQHEEDKPVDLGEGFPIPPGKARFQLDKAIPGMRYETLNSAGEVIGADSRIVVDAQIGREQVVETFRDCVGTAPTDIRIHIEMNPLGIKKVTLIDRQVTLGQRCMALASLEEDMYWSMAESQQLGQA